MDELNPVCQCGDRESEHIDGCERCIIPECGCKEFTEPATEEEIKADREFSAEQEAQIERMIKEDEQENREG